MGAVDLFPTLCGMAGIDAAEALRQQGVDQAASDYFDGVDMSEALRGRPVTRTKLLFWEYGRDDSYLRPAREDDRSPNLAVRDGQWKLLMNADGSRVELYDLTTSPDEHVNVAETHPEVRDRLRAELTAWRASLPGSQR